MVENQTVSQLRSRNESLYLRLGENLNPDCSTRPVQLMLWRVPLTAVLCYEYRDKAILEGLLQVGSDALTTGCSMDCGSYFKQWPRLGDI